MWPHKRPVRALALAVVVVFLVLDTAPTADAAAADAPNGKRSYGTGSAYGGHVTDFSTLSVQEFSHALNAVQVPLLLIIFDNDDKAALQKVWRPFLSQIGDALHLFALRTAVAVTSSLAGQQLVNGFGIEPPALLLFDGILRLNPQRVGEFGKIPTGYGGELSVPKVVHWVMENISPDLVHRIDTTDDLARLFMVYPGFPEIPRVLYFTASNYVSPHIRIVSQFYQPDAVVGAVVEPLATPERAAVAARYGIRTAEDLPAVVVLRPSPETPDIDEVVHLTHVTAHSTVEQLIEALHHELPDSAIHALEHLAATGDQSRVVTAERRKRYVIETLARERAELFGDEDPTAAAAAAAAVPDDAHGLATGPITVVSQREWQHYCAQMRPGHHCLAVVAGKEEREAALTILREVSAKILKSVPTAMRAAVHVVLLDAARSGKIMEFFMLGQQGLPDAVLLTATSLKTYYNFVGSFTSDNLVRFYLSKTQARKTVGGSRYIPHKVPALEEELRTANVSDVVREARDDGEDL